MSAKMLLYPYKGVGGTIMRARRTILVVDDEPAVRKLMEISLKRAGYRVFTASDGREAIRISGHIGDDIDLAVIDGIMPGMNGPDTLQALRERHPHLPALFVSGFATDEELRGITAELLLKKPFSGTDLITAVAEAMDQHSVPAFVR